MSSRYNVTHRRYSGGNRSVRMGGCDAPAEGLSCCFAKVADGKQLEDYLPAELPRLEDPFLFVKGRYVVLCISDYNEEVEAELKELLKK